MFKLPLLILTYNRSDKLLKLIKILNKIRPLKIYVSCDGPKNNTDIKEIKKIHTTLNFVHKKTKIIKNFYKKNKGIKLAPQAGISWFFKKEKMGIILEDDCLPNDLFFKYTKKLLMKYKNNKKIFAICGYNPLEKTNFGDGFYFLSNYFLCWGWATWRRSWLSLDKNLNSFVRSGLERNLRQKFKNNIEFRYWKKTIKQVQENKIKTWDIQFGVSVWKNKSYCLLPNMNLVDNIGFDNTSTTSPGVKYKVAKVTDCNRKIKSPSVLQINQKNEDLIFNAMFLPKFFLYPWRIIFIIKTLFFQPKFFFNKVKLLSTWRKL